MKGERGLVIALGVAFAAGVAAFPLLGWFGSLPAAAAAFYVVALIGSGFRVVRAVVWGLLVAALCAIGILGPDPVASVAYAAGAVLFFAGVLLPSFRRWWFGRAIE